MLTNRHVGRRMWQVLALSASVGLLLQSCATVMAHDAKISGSVRLEGSSQHDGVAVSVDELRTVYSDASGNYEITCRVNGADKFVLVFRKSGYVDRVLGGKLPESTEKSSDVEISMETVTLARGQ